MTFTEADKIFQIWRKWYWPFDFILHSIFLGKIPESFLPYPKDVLEEALNIVAKHCYEIGDSQYSKLIQDSIVALWEYTKDENAFQQAAESLANPEMREVMLIHISNFKNDWINWLNKQDDQKNVT